MSELLRRALADARLTEEDVAARVGVDLKTVRRWLAGRLPYPRNRRTLADLLDSHEDDLWPHAATLRASLPEAPASEILATYPHRWSVPRSAWQRHFESARSEIGILAYAGLFLAEDSGLLRVLGTKARDGVTVRILLGDPDGAHVPERGAEEGVNEAMAAKIRNALVLYRPLLAVPGVEVRLHDTVLYNSIYRADRALLVNPHIYGVAASHAPIVLLHRLRDGDMASTYLNSFDLVWESASTLSRDR
ncbi:helix-turn-helix domain-containing protein [Actinomadura kijaniata]|uniref:helix-turn-helix domain-containing protein n=1 Tax=Actinomadura kijaniata TaxID=46161 RepID=UPI000831C36C|nr:helix-turn-helix transcriptional regulator [Actinomadura kijaniata]